MKQSDKRGDRNKKDNKINGWKWAFFVLAALNLIGFFLFMLAIRPVDLNTTNPPVNQIAEESVELSTSMNKEDTEQLINTYLSNAAGEDYEDYHIALTDQLEIHGLVEFLGADVPFSLFLEPYVMEDGNVQLRGEAVEVANFSLPVRLVMRLVGNQVDFPDFVAFDSESQIIVIHLDQLTEDYNFDVEMTTIDLVDSVIELTLRIDESAILDQIQMDQSRN